MKFPIYGNKKMFQTTNQMNIMLMWKLFNRELSTATFDYQRDTAN